MTPINPKDAKRKPEREREGGREGRRKGQFKGNGEGEWRDGHEGDLSTHDAAGGFEERSPVQP
jgi:hypothetical protein